MWYWTEAFISDPRVPALLSFPARHHFKAIFLYYFFFFFFRSRQIPPPSPPNLFFFSPNSPPFPFFFFPFFPPPPSLPHLSSLSHNALLSQFFYPLYFPPSLSHPHPVPLCLHISFLQLMPPPLYQSPFPISLSPPSISYALPLDPSILLRLIPCLSLSRSLFYMRPFSIFTPFILLFFVFPSVLPGEGHFQIRVHELWPLPGYAAGPEPQWLLHMGHGEPEAQHRPVRQQGRQRLFPGLAGSVLPRHVPRQLHSHGITGLYEIHRKCKISQEEFLKRKQFILKSTPSRNMFFFVFFPFQS